MYPPEKSNIEDVMEQYTNWIPDVTKKDYAYNIRSRMSSIKGDLDKDELKLIQDALEKGVDKLDYRDDNFIRALQSKSEIMLDCDEYYYIKTTHYRNIVNLFLRGKEMV